MFSPFYEPLRLGYLRLTGRSEYQVMIIEEEIVTRNEHLATSLHSAVQAARDELELREQRLGQFLLLQGQGIHVNRRGWEHLIQPTTKRPVKFIPRDKPRIVVGGKRPRQEAKYSAPKRRHRSDPTPEEVSRRAAALVPTALVRQDQDPAIPLEAGEHPSRGKVAGKLTGKKAARAAVFERRVAEEEVELDASKQNDNFILELDAEDDLYSDL